jgi:hypothetical protein
MPSLGIRGRARSGTIAAVLASALLGVGACGRIPQGQSVASPAPTPSATSRLSPTPGASDSPLTETFPYGQFDDPITIDNPWLPLRRGSRWAWEGETVEDGETTPHRVVFIVTDMTKVIDGVQAVVGWDRDYSAGQLVEAEIVFLAQDNAGAVWHLGQYPEEYEDGRLVAHPGWIAGVQGALAGYWMTADPRPGSRSYSQGWGPAVDWTDRGRVIDIGLSDCVPVGCFDNVLVIEEWALDEPKAKQLKYYAQGVGNTRVGWSGSAEQEQETLELTQFEQLGRAELEAARNAVLALEKRAYENASEWYGDTEPMKPRS